MNRPVQVVLEIGNTQVKAGLIEVSSLPIKKFPSWGFKDDKRPVKEAVEFDEKLHTRALKNDEIYDFDFLIELIEYSLEKELDISKESFEQVQLTLLLPSPLIAVQLPFRSKLIRSIYDRLKVAGVFLGETAVMASLGSAHGTALILNFDDEGISLAATNDFSLVTSTTEYFNCPSEKLFKNISTIAKFDFKSDLIDQNLSDFNSEIKLTDGRCLDLEIFYSAFEETFVNERSFNGLNLINVIESIMERLDPDRRSITLNHIILTGQLPLPYPLLCHLLSSNILPALLAVSDYPADSQPSAISFRSIPDYYNEIKESGRDSIAWFGASLTGKYAHSDSKTFIPSKQIVSNN